MQIKTDLVLFNAAVKTANTSFNSSAVYVGDYTGLAIQTNYSTGTTINGAYTLEASCDPIGETPTTWTTVEDSSVAVTASASGTVFYNVSDVWFNYIRLVFTYDTTSGTQTITSRIVAKGQD